MLAGEAEILPIRVSTAAQNQMLNWDIVPIGVISGLYWGYIGIMEKKMETTML